MVNQSSNPARVWKLATGLSVILAAVGIGAARIESQRAARLADSVKSQQQLVVSLQARLVEAEKPSLPIALTFRPALMGSGLVGMFRNVSSSQLEIAATFSSQATGMLRQANLVIPANATKEIGHAEGWAFASGQHVQLTNIRFRPAVYEVPQT